jgi:hypothetical protein
MKLSQTNLFNISRKTYQDQIFLKWQKNVLVVISKIKNRINLFNSIYRHINTKLPKFSRD